MIDSSIPLNPNRPVKQPGIATLGQLVALRGAEQETHRRQMELEQAQQAQQTNAQREQAFSALLQSGEAYKNPEAVFAVAGPERAKAFYDGLSAFQRLKAGEKQERDKSMLAVLRSIEVLPDSEKPKAWTFAYQGLAQSGVIPNQPELAEFDPTKLKVLIAQLGGEPQKPDMVTVAPGGTVFNRTTGKPEYTAPERPEKPPTVSLQSRPVMSGGRPIMAAFNPQTGQYQDQSGKVLTDVRPIPTAAQSGAQAAPAEELPADPASSDILSQTGLSMNGFMALTGRLTQLPRDAATRNRATAEAQAFARKTGVDVSTLASQYKAQNTVLERNIERLNNTKIMESELKGTVENLQNVIGNDFSKVRIANVWKVWAGEQVNDPAANQYAFHLGQLRNELAAYYAAAAGRPGSGITVQDLNEAEKTIKNGIAQGGLVGLKKGVEDSTSKMGPIMQGSVDRATKAVWDLFGVGKNYKPKGGPAQTGGVKILSITPVK